MELRTDRYKLKEIFPDRAKKYAQKLHVKADEIEYVRKGIPIDPVDISIEEGERAAIRLITTPRLDRDGEILIPDGAILDDFRQSPSVLFGHKYDTLPIGKDIWIKQGPKGILAKTIYANHQFAEDAFQCVKGGFMNSNSVGFIPIERITQGDARFKDVVNRLEKDYGVSRDEANEAKAIYTKWLLLEHSDVPVASNAQSLNIAVSKGELVLDSKAFKDEMGIPEEPIPEAPVEEKAAEIVTKPETTDQYHRIPVSDGHEGHEIRTIAVSEKDGIKALYCVDCKEIKTYLFDVDRFTMAEAEAWVEEHKKGIRIFDVHDDQHEMPVDYIAEVIEQEGSPTQEAVINLGFTEKQAPVPPDLSAEMASLRQDVAAILARLQVTPAPVPVPAPAPAPDDIAFEPSIAPAEDMVIESSPEITIENGPEKSVDESKIVPSVQELLADFNEINHKLWNVYEVMKQDYEDWTHGKIPLLTIHRSIGNDLVEISTQLSRQSWKIRQTGWDLETEDTIKGMANASEEIAIEREPDITIEPDVLDKAIEEHVDNFLLSDDHKRIVKEAVEVALAKMTGKVI